MAVLPCSSILYAEPFADMKIGSWIEGHINAFEYYGGVPRLLVPDNTKTAVIKINRYESDLNKTYKDMSDYYGTTVIPTRPRAPRDKAPVETGVQIIERRIIAKLRHSTFFSLDEIKDAFSAELEILNNQSFQKQSGSRLSVFLESEKNELLKLPEQRYEYAEYKTAKVGFDYHVALDKSHFYSVPYQYAGKTAVLRVTTRIVEVFCEGERIASHERNRNVHKRYVTNTAHMPEKHRAVADWSPQRFISWAAKTGPQTKAYIAALLKSREHPEQSYRLCSGILRLASTVKPEVMEQVAADAIAKGVYSYSFFQKLLNAPANVKPVIHENIRGRNYYEGESYVE